MQENLLHCLDFCFLAGHSALIAFNLFGWTWKRTRRLNLLSIGLTAGSWLAFAPWYGLGYCPCTDWHWQVKEQLGESALPHSFIKYLWDKIFLTPISPKAVDLLTFIAFFTSLIAALYFRWTEKKKLDFPTED